MKNETTPPVTLRADGDIALITIESPPVNALSHAVRSGLLAALRSADSDPAIRAIVLSCEGKTFVAGADVTEFAKPPQAPHLPEVTQAIESSTKPVVVALHGTALGGGFELALASHYRIAARGAKVGLPEVKLGIMPGYGGTQRLPRLVGKGVALHLILTGGMIGAQEAHSHGLWESVKSVPELTLAKSKVLFGVSVVENAYRQPVLVEVAVAVAVFVATSSTVVVGS